jgi:hypothetical protein
MRAATTGGYVSKAGEIVQRILTTRCGVAVGDWTPRASPR